MYSVRQSQTMKTNSLIGLSLWGVASITSAQLIFMPQNNFQPIADRAPSVPVDLSALYDNKAFGREPNETDFDGSGGVSYISLLLLTYQ